jgi:DNA-directed RNA polymerase specialized sigma24 family protein
VNKADRELTPEDFDRLLAALDPERDEAGKKYVELHHRLVKFFEWKQAYPAESLADETLLRVCLKLRTIELPENLKNYSFGIARFVLLEHQGEQKRRPMDQLPDPDPKSGQVPAKLPAGMIVQFIALDVSDDDRVVCFEGCLKQLSDEKRRMIVGYYVGETSEKIENRKKMAAELQIDQATLRKRAQRERDKLEDCVNDCCKRKQ